MNVVAVGNAPALAFFHKTIMNYLSWELNLSCIQRNKIATTLFLFCFLSLYNYHSKPPSGDGGGGELR
jgi:hypothetical protein